MPEIQISVKGIENLLKSLNPHKAAGPNQLNPIVLQTLHAELVTILQVIFQKSLDSETLPYIWKEANVSPIFKKGGKSDPANLISPDITSICFVSPEPIGGFWPNLHINTTETWERNG